MCSLLYDDQTAHWIHHRSFGTPEPSVELSIHRSKYYCEYNQYSQEPRNRIIEIYRPQVSHLKTHLLVKQNEAQTKYGLFQVQLEKYINFHLSSNGLSNLTAELLV